MAMFFFHLLTPHGLERDEWGIEIGSVEEARTKAREAIPDLAGELLQDGVDPMRCALIVDDGRADMLTVPFFALLKQAAPA